MSTFMVLILSLFASDNGGKINDSSWGWERNNGSECIMALMHGNLRTDEVER